jgi:aminopeptidase YwaD
MEQVKKNLQAHIETMCLEYGSRHCGSEGERATAAYIEQYFTEQGLTVVSEEFPSRGWNFEHFALYNVTKDRPVRGGTTACFFSASVNLTDTFLFLSNADLQKLDELPVQGKLCFLTNCSGYNRNTLAEKLEQLGAAAAVFTCNTAGNGVNTKVSRSPHITRIGTAAVNLTAAYDIAQNASDTYRLYIKAHSFDTVSRNIVARIGSGSKKCVVGGHYDTAPLIQGANDNASGTAMVMELARLMAGKSLPFVLEFVAFSGEEYCDYNIPAGSTAYMERHKDENIAWYLNCDSCADPFTSTSLLLGLKEKLPPIVSDHPIAEKTTGGDNATFCSAGIPAVWLRSGLGFTMLHTIEDSVDKLDFDLVAKNFLDTYDILQQLIANTN